jgi:hypothetical protein
VNSRPAKRIQIRPLTWLLIAVGLAFVAIAILYFADTAAALPSWVPGHQAGSAHHHTKHGIAAIGLAIVSWIGAWFTTAPTR